MVSRIIFLSMITISCNEPRLSTTISPTAGEQGSDDAEVEDEIKTAILESDEIKTITTKDDEPQETPNTDNEVTHDSKQYLQGATNSVRPLDILLVVDVSQSMASIRVGLGTRLRVLLEQVKQNDWRLAITTTNLYDCLLEKWILLKTPQGKFMRDKVEFNKIISEGEDSCGEICKVCPRQDTTECPEWSDQWIWDGLRHNEHPIGMAINALGGNISSNLPKENPTNDVMCQRDGNKCDYPEIPEEHKGKAICGGKRSLTERNNDWLRSDSMIAVIIVTDEDNSEHAKNENGESQPSIDLDTRYLTNHLENDLNRKRGTSYEIYGILNPRANDSYKKIITANNIQNVQDTRYDVVLGKISSGIRTTLHKTLDISDIANKNNFKFKGIEGKEKDVHYTYQNKIITFIDGYVPAKNEKIIVNYSYTK